MYFIRYSNFEKEIPEDFPMPKVYEADITELVKPHYEKGLQEGLQQGIKEGLQKGLQEGLEKGEFKAKIETAKKMKKEGISLDLIIKITGLSKKDLKKYNII
jgi:flagellar biosynthesis/type III secretory pathway protein FliH